MQVHPCPYCGTGMRSGSYYCKHCRRNLGAAVESFNRERLPGAQARPNLDYSETLKGHPGLGPFGVRRELKQISATLAPSEGLLDIIQGAYASQTGVLLATDRRMIFLAKGWVTLKVEDFPLEKISSVQYETGLLTGTITIFASGNKAQITHTVKAHTKAFAEGVRNRLLAAPAPAPPPVQPSSRSDTMAELDKLATLRERGLLSDEEFTAAKRKLLGL